MNTIPAQEIKRRGISAVDEALESGPVHVLHKKSPKYVILSENDYRNMLSELAEVRLKESMDDLQAGRVTSGSVAELMEEIMSEG